jgi:hypothetical protein
MSQSEDRSSSHNILIYPNIEAFRRVYSSYIKNQLEHGNEIVLILPYYETADKVREVLLSEGIVYAAATIEGNGESNDNNNTMNVKISDYEKEGSLVLKDSVKVYSSSGPDSSSNNTMWNLIQESVKRAENLGKNGVTVIADLGSFYHHLGDTQRLVEYELSLPSRYDNGLKLKGVCVYHKKDFENKFTEEQKQKLLQHHRQVFIVKDR